MAEAIARRDASDIIEASSAGLTPLGYVMPMTKQTIASNGCPTDELASKALLASAYQAADIVINSSGWPRESAFRDAAKVEDWYVEDPYDGDAEMYQKTFQDIERRVRRLAEMLRTSRPSNIVAGDAKEPATDGTK